MTDTQPPKWATDAITSVVEHLNDGVDEDDTDNILVLTKMGLKGSARIIAEAAELDPDRILLRGNIETLTSLNNLNHRWVERLLNTQAKVVEVLDRIVSDEELDGVTPETFKAAVALLAKLKETRP